MKINPRLDLEYLFPISNVDIVLFIMRVLDRAQEDVQR